MDQNKKIHEPDDTAVRTALWRALHVQIDETPHIIEDEVGLQLIAPPNDWQQRPDMKFTKRLRASIVARARFVDDLIIEQSKRGIRQYVILGAGLDTFAQRRQDIASRLQIYEREAMRYSASTTQRALTKAPCGRLPMRCLN